MLRNRTVIGLAALFLAVGFSAWLGCKPSETAQNPPAEPEALHVGNHLQEQEPAHQPGGARVANIDATTPEKAITTFLEAVRLGDAETAASLLTVKAHTEMQNAEMHVLPPGSPDAQYQINNVSLEPEHGGAFVDSLWSDKDETGEFNSYQITWILRQENKGWRVAGMSTPLIPDFPMVVLNFEDPADMQAQVKKVNDEMDRRAAAEGEILQATRPPESTEPPLR